MFLTKEQLIKRRIEKILYVLGCFTICFVAESLFVLTLLYHI